MGVTPLLIGGSGVVVCMSRTGDAGLPEAASIGNVGLRVHSLEAVLPFYRDVLGLAVNRNGDRALVGPNEELLVLEQVPDAPVRGPTEAGLFHVAFRVPSREALADAVARIRDHGGSLTGASDHLVSEALYLRDPEDNGIEIYRDRPKSDWPWTDDGGVDMDTLPLDVEALQRLGTGADKAPDSTDIGHVHLEVTDLEAAESFYVDTLGMNVRARYGTDATFVAAGDYHHHIGLNTWNNRTEPVTDSLGIQWIELKAPDQDTVTTLKERWSTTEADGSDAVVTDPDGIPIRITLV